MTIFSLLARCLNALNTSPRFRFGESDDSYKLASDLGRFLAQEKSEPSELVITVQPRPSTLLVLTIDACLKDAEGSKEPDTPEIFRPRLALATSIAKHIIEAFRQLHLRNITEDCRSVSAQLPNTPAKTSEITHRDVKQEDAREAIRLLHSVIHAADACASIYPEANRIREFLATLDTTAPSPLQ